MSRRIFHSARASPTWRGISGENMTRLMADEPIVVQVAELGLPPMKILLIGGRTEEAIAAQLTAKYGPARTTVNKEPEG